MNLAFDILVIALGSLFGISLIISIVILVQVLKLVKAVKAVVSKGEQLVDSAEEWTATLQRNAAAANVLKTIMKFVKK